MILAAGAVVVGQEIPKGRPAAEAKLIDTAGKRVGEVHFVETDLTQVKTQREVEITIELEGFAPGNYEVAIHEWGACQTPAFTSAGPVWGIAGPLPDLIVPQERRVLSVRSLGNMNLDTVSNRSLLERSIVITSGSGERVACGVIEQTDDSHITYPLR
jgi:Cu/Zn superoxide dismutase